MLNCSKNFCFLFLILVFGCVLCLTNTFADENVDPIDIEEIIAAGNFDFPTPDGAGYIQGNAEYKKSPESIIGTPDFEKMRDLPRDSQDYILGTKVGWFVVPQRNNPSRFWICTGFLVGPDLFMTNHHCFHDEAGTLSLENAAILMDYYQDPEVDPTRGGLTARVSEILRMDELKDYALLRLDKPIGNTYGWLELDTTTHPNSSQSVKLISHPQGRSKEIVRRNSEIVDIPLGHPLLEVPFGLAYLADSQGGSSGSPVFLREGTGVIAIHHSAWSLFGVPQFNAGTLMSYIVPEIRQFLPPSVPVGPTSDLVVEAPMVSDDYVLPGGSFTFSATVRNQGDAAAPATTLRVYNSTDSTITTDDIELSKADVPPLQPDETIEINFSLTAPTPLGEYHGGACVDTVDNENNSGNNCSPSVTITVTDTPPVYMYWIDSGTDTIQRANLDGSNVRDIVTTGLRTPTNIALNMNARQVYWVDSSTDTIQRANLDGSNIEDVITTGLRTPTSIAVDTFSDSLYWIDSGTDTIQRANLDGSNIEDVITTGLRTPTSIAVDAYDPELGKMYWTDSGTDKIQRANFNGSNIEDLVTTGLRTPTGIALDLAAGKMYWIDSGTDKIQRANLDGSKIEDLVTTGLRTPTGIAVDPEAGKMYWIDSGTDKIQRANLDGSKIEDLVTTGLRTPTGIALSIPQMVSPTPPPPGPGPGPGPGPAPGSVDVNGDGQVTVIDLAIVALFYGMQVPGGASLPADVNDDGVVDLSDLVAVAEAIDAAGNGGVFSADAVAAVLEAVAEQADAVEGIAEAPAHFSTSQHALLSGVAYRNVAAAFEAAKHLTTDDIRLGKWMPMLKELLHLLTEMREIPDTTALLPNYPNPFNPETWIPYHLSKGTEVIVTIHDAQGVVVRTLTLGHQAAGVYESREHAAYWDGKNASGESVASGVYFYTLTAGEFTATRKLLIIK